MNTASLELSKELYELSGWNSEYNWYNQHGEYQPVATDDVEHYPYIYPVRICAAYDLGYLLRKLPRELPLLYMKGKFYYSLQLRKNKEYWLACYPSAKDIFQCAADTPEDAAAKLVIELFKQDILIRD